MKKRLFLTEEESNRILDLHKKAILNEEDRYYQSPDGSVGVLTNMVSVPPAGSTFISKDAYDVAVKNKNFITTQTTTVAPTVTNPPQNESDGLKLQKLLNSKFQAGLKEDGKVGPLTTKAALNAITGVQPSTTQTTTVAGSTTQTTTVAGSTTQTTTVAGPTTQTTTAKVSAQMDKSFEDL